MKKLAVITVVAMMMASCGGGKSGGSGSAKSGNDGGGKNSAKITMTTEADGFFTITIGGIGEATFDWGDGSEKRKINLNYNGDFYNHNYSNPNLYTITFNGNHISLFRCSNIKSLDLSRCPELEELLVMSSPLTSLDLSKNVALEKIDLTNNQFTAAGLNALFNTLHNKEQKSIYKTKSINIEGNPGAEDCDRSIAEKKGWRVSW